ncbi:MAG: FKBP-type peptidyl-prolyl cis-trans isomerase [Candidatus Delongbacteria bacterium]|nr:FKBP-type peptidyl-prolyl cis-trans isomerase [Candidatus Delongbacteria bacterium]MCG2761534.1 FKBP-type peptidyl-prolyl cis-trans isomerase [Candidatus Delongbacteria bacterium]
MIKRIAVTLLISVFALILGCSEEKAADFKKLTRSDLLTKAQKESYVFGIDLARNLKASKDGFDADSFVKGITDEIKKYPFLLSDEEMEAVRKEGMKTQDEAKRKKEDINVNAKRNAQQSDQYLSENMKNKNVKSLKGGLQYIIIKEGSGTKPVLSDKIKINYTGTLISGEEFENTYKKGEPAVLQLKNTVKGFQEGLLMMKAGSKYKLFVPPKLGYGTAARGVIPPNSVLIFEVELLEIIKSIE